MIRRHWMQFAVVAVIAALPLLTVSVRAEEEDEGKEEKLTLKDCPPAVQKTIKEKAADAEITGIEKQTLKDNSVRYEVKIKKGDSRKEFYVAADGKFLRWQSEHNEGEEHKGDKDKDDKD